jgi:hypothetical protein
MFRKRQSDTALVASKIIKSRYDNFANTETKNSEKRLKEENGNKFLVLCSTRRIRSFKR